MAELDRVLDDGFVPLDDEGDSDALSAQGIPTETRTVPVDDDFSVIDVGNESRSKTVLTPTCGGTILPRGGQSVTSTTTIRRSSVNAGQWGA